MRGQTFARRTFWWDRTVEVEPLRAVIFDLDGAVADVDRDGDLEARSGLIDLVMSLFVAGVWVAMVSTKPRAEAEPLVRQLIGDGLVETIVTSDDADSTDSTDLYALALWEFGIEPRGALAVAGSSAGGAAAAEAGLASVVVHADYTAELDSTSACQRLHRRWCTDRKPAAA